MATRRPGSPCISICTLDETRTCMGCRRTLDEIRSWGNMTPEQQWALVEDLRSRAPYLEELEKP